MKIPIPSLEVQRGYVANIADAVTRNMTVENVGGNLGGISYVESLGKTIQKTDIKELFALAIKKQFKLPTTEWVPFGDVFELVKGELQSSKVEEDEDGDGVLINLSLKNNFKRIFFFKSGLTKSR